MDVERRGGVVLGGVPIPAFNPSFPEPRGITQIAVVVMLNSCIRQIFEAGCSSAGLCWHDLNVMQQISAWLLEFSAHQPMTKANFTPFTVYKCAFLPEQIKFINSVIIMVNTVSQEIIIRHFNGPTTQNCPDANVFKPHQLQSVRQLWLIPCIFTLLHFWKKSKKKAKDGALEMCPLWCHTVAAVMLLQGWWHPLTAEGWSC